MQMMQLYAVAVEFNNHSQPGLTYQVGVPYRRGEAGAEIKVAVELVTQRMELYYPNDMWNVKTVNYRGIVLVPDPTKDTAGGTLEKLYDEQSNPGTPIVGDPEQNSGDDKVVIKEPGEPGYTTIRDRDVMKDGPTYWKTLRERFL